MPDSISSEMLAKMIMLHEVRVPLTVGRATVAWNTLSGTVFDHFHLLSEMEEDAAKSIFFTVASDRSQRDMVSRLFDLKIKPNHPKLAKKAKSLLGEADKLAGKRNDILHVVFRNSHDAASVDQLHERGHLKGKAGTVLLDAIDNFAISCLDLSLGLIGLRGEILEKTRYQNQAMVEALLRYSSQQKAEEWANQGVFGLLNFPATNPRSSEETQE